MSDDIVSHMTQTSLADNHVHLKARIEELEAENYALLSRANNAEDEGYRRGLERARQVYLPRIEDLEAKLSKAIGLLSRAVDTTGEPHCYHDHHGYCQAHNLEPRGECWVEQSQAFIAELTGGKDE